MKVWLWVAAVATAVAAIIIAVDVSVDAHHASAPFYDNTKSAEVNGEVTRFLFRNPHSFLYIDSPGDGGQIVHWEIEMGTAVSMSRRGWTAETIKAGDEIKVVGQPSRAPGTRGMCCAELSRPDGSSIRP